jgi:hypothetical protein
MDHKKSAITTKTTTATGLIFFDAEQPDATLLHGKKEKAKNREKILIQKRRGAN